jgi:hypothetical protein
VRVVALEGGKEGKRDGIRGGERQGGGRIEVLNCGLEKGGVG